MRPVIVTVGPLATASANNIALSQTPAVPNLVLNGAVVTGGVARLDTPRQVLITTTGNESARAFTITGTNFSGMPQSETVQGPNIGTAASLLDYATVTSITINGAAVAPLTVGTNGIAGSPWVRFDDWSAATIAIQASVTGTVNYTLQQTLDDPNNPTNPIAVSAVNWVAYPDAYMVAATTTQQANYAYVPTYARILLNSGTGSVTATFIQSEVVGR